MKRFLIYCLLLVTGACVRSQPQFVVVTSTFPPESLPETPPLLSAPTVAPAAVTAPTVLPQRPKQVEGESEYLVQPGDTLSNIAASYGLSVETLLSVNDIPDPNILSVGQVIKLPNLPSSETPSQVIVPDNRLVRAPGSSSFDIAGFINQQQGYIRIATDLVDDRLLNSAEVVQRVSLEFSVDARLLLALLEYRSDWLSNQEIDEDSKIYPIQKQPSPDGIDRSGLYRQLAWAANQLNRGYYGRKYRGLTTLEFSDGTRLRYAGGLNAATVGVQYLFSLLADFSTWLQAVGAEGYYRTYTSYFDYSLENPTGAVIDGNLIQPDLTLPFQAGETWFFTGGPHGGWGSGSAWASIDFAPPDDMPENSPACYTSEFWVTALAPGLVARSKDGAVVLDLDGDGDEATGWTILYLHIATEDRVEAGRFLQTGDNIGHPSCEGGVSNATHLHIARRYNGEWIPVDCAKCPPDQNVPSFVMSGWEIFGFPGQEYQGYMVKNGEQRIADQGRLSPENHISW